MTQPPQVRDFTNRFRWTASIIIMNIIWIIVANVLIETGNISDNTKDVLAWSTVISSTFMLVFSFLTLGSVMLASQRAENEWSSYFKSLVEQRETNRLSKSVYYRLDRETHEVIPFDLSYTDYGGWPSLDERAVKQEVFNDKYFVSTVFLVLSHGEDDHGNQYLFETMAFDWDAEKGEPSSWGEKYIRRYTSWDDAVAGHEELINFLNGGGELN